MPGKNSKFDPSRNNCFVRFVSTRVHIGVLATVGFVDIWGLARYFWIWPELRFCTEMWFYAFLFISCEFIAFLGMYRTKNADPGYLLFEN